MGQEGRYYKWVCDQCEEENHLHLPRHREVAAKQSFESAAQDMVAQEEQTRALVLAQRDEVVGQVRVEFQEAIDLAHDRMVARDRMVRDAIDGVAAMHEICRKHQQKVPYGDLLEEWAGR